MRRGCDRRQPRQNQDKTVSATESCLGKLIGAGDEPGRPRVCVSMGGVQFTALVDTGAAVMLLRLQEFEQYRNRTHRSPFLRSGPRLCGVAGTALDVRGRTEVMMDGVTRPLEVVVVSGITHSMIIGAPHLHKGGATLDFKKGQLRWFNRCWSLVADSHDEEVGLIYNSPREITGFGPDLPEVSSAHFRKLIAANAGVFSGKGEPHGECGITKMTIHTTGMPISQKAYRTPLHKRRLVEDCVQEMLAEGVIRPSSSPWASPIILVPNASGETRFCVDYRRLNARTVRDQYPLPLIEDIFDQVAGSAVYSTLDLRAGYHQIKMAEADIPKTAFRCHLGLFEYLRMPFGLANGPAVFQRTMDKVLAGLIGRCVFVYLDDLVVYSASTEEHEEHLKSVVA